jgi:hypothetical protein
VTKRRLPVLPNAAPEEEAAEPRPTWHWVGFGTVAIFATWLPLAYGAQALHAWSLRRRFGVSGSADEIFAVLSALDPAIRRQLLWEMAAPHAVALVLASFAGGFLVGRFGDRTGIREAALAGVTTSTVAALLSLSSAGVAALVPFVLAVPFASLGGYVGAKKKTRA